MASNNERHIEVYNPENAEVAELVKVYALGSDFIKEGNADLINSANFSGIAEGPIPDKPAYSLDNVINHGILAKIRETYSKVEDKQAYIKQATDKFLVEDRLDIGLEELVFLSGQYLATKDVQTVRKLFDVSRSNIIQAGLYDHLTRFGVVETAIGRALTENKLAIDATSVKSLITAAIENSDDELIRSVGLVVSPEVRKEIIASENYSTTVKAKVDFGRVKYQSFEDIPDREEIVKNTTKMLEQALEDTDKRSQHYDVKMVAKLATALPFTYAKDIFVEQIKTMDPNDKNLPRLLREFTSIDSIKAGKLTLGVLSSDEIPDRMFKYLSEMLVESNYFTPNFSKYLALPGEKPYLQHLVNEYPFEVNTVLDTLAGLGSTEHPYLLGDNFQIITSALEDLGSITPSVYNRYMALAPAERLEFVEQIRGVKKNLFKNITVDKAIPEHLKDFSSELIYLTYLPSGLSYDNAIKLIGNVHDCTEQVRRFEVPENGYDFYIAEKSYKLKEGEKIVMDKTNQLVAKIWEEPTTEEVHKQELQKILRRVANTTSDLVPDEIGALINLMGTSELVQKIKGSTKAGINDDNTYEVLTELREVLTTAFQEDFSGTLTTYLKGNPDVYQSLTSVLSQPVKAAQLKKQLSTADATLDWDNVTKSEEAMAEILSTFLQHSVLKPYKSELTKNIKKFGEVPGKTKHMKAYVSKSVPAFFSKGSVGLCTAEDIELFERDDYVQFTIVEDNERVVANIQGYIFPEEEGSQALILRGFNPRNDVMEAMNIPHFCDQVLSMGRSFAEVNNLSRLYITDQKRWAALSNKEVIANYMMRKYFKDDAKKAVDFPLTANYRMDILYEIPMSP